MYDIPAFGPWSEDIHRNEREQRTIERARLAETSPVPGSVDREKQTATFYGTKVYEVSLDFCPCGGFTRKHPCKHIYRLAMELGIIDVPFETGESKGERNERQLSLSDAKMLFEKLSPKAQQEAYGFMQYSREARHMKVLETDPEIIEEFRSCPLLEEHEATDMILNRMKRKEIWEIVGKSGVECPLKKNVSKETVLAWLRESVPDLAELLPKYAVFSYIVNFDKAQVALMKELNEKMREQYAVEWE